MLQYFRHKNIDKKKWDACIAHAWNGSVFACSWYLDIVTGEKWDGLILGNYEAVMPIPHRKKINIAYIYQPFFTRYTGVFSERKQSNTLLSDFLTAISSHYQYQEFCLHEIHSVVRKEYHVKTRMFQELALNPSYEELYSCFSDNAKRNIRKAVKAGLYVKKNVAPEIVVDLFKKTKGRDLNMFSPREYKLLLKLMHTCKTKKGAESLAVYDANGNLCACGFFMYYNHRFTFLKSGVTEQGKNQGAMHFLFDSFIKEHAGAEYLLDFGGSSVENVARFYRNFGATDRSYLQVKKNNLPRLIKWVSRKS